MTMLAVTVMIGSIALSGVSTAQAQLEEIFELEQVLECGEGSYPTVVGYQRVNIVPAFPEAGFTLVPIIECKPLPIPEIDADVVPGPN